MSKRTKGEIPYCTCKGCVCIDCKIPFATWIKDKPNTFKTIQRFGGRCKECNELWTL